MLSPYIKAEALNGGIGGTRLAVKGLGNLEDGGLDKRTSDGAVNSIRTVKDVVNVAQTVSDTITNLAGTRSPYYVIGEVLKEASWGQSAYKWGAAGNLVRAVSKYVNGTEQDGVIIDCLGDIQGNMSVEFTKNPLVYQSSTITDSRIRKPSTVKATVAVSNYLSDNAVGAAINAVGQVFGDITKEITNQICYNGNTRAQQALYKLRWLMENGKPFTVYTPHGMYENMLIESITPRTSEDTMDCLMCEIIFREVIMCMPYFSEGSSVNMPARKNVVETSGNSPISTIKSWGQ
jgi:hypothetical protein